MIIIWCTVTSYVPVRWHSTIQSARAAGTKRVLFNLECRGLFKYIPSNAISHTWHASVALTPPTSVMTSSRVLLPSAFTILPKKKTPPVEVILYLLLASYVDTTTDPLEMRNNLLASPYDSWFLIILKKTYSQVYYQRRCIGYQKHRYFCNNS